MPFEIRVDCPACRFEGARLETWEPSAPSCRLGLPHGTRCLLCGHAGEGRAATDATVARGEGCPGCGSALDEASLAAHRCPFCAASAELVETSPARVPGTTRALEGALATWAAAEDLASPAELLEGYFVLSTPEAILAAVTRGETVETTFDVVEYLFSSGRGQGGDPVTEPVRAGAEGDPQPRAPAEPVDRLADAPLPTWPTREIAPALPLTTAPPVSARGLGGPRDELLALASVAASDGEASPDDLAALVHAAAMRGIPPLAIEDIRVRRPVEIDPPPTLVQREKLLEEMFWLAWSDEQLDESEVRVVRDFARAWGVDPQRVAEWTAIANSRGSSRVARWIDRVGYFLFPGW